MKKLLVFMFICVSVIAMTGCMSSKNFTYFENIDSISLAPSKGHYDAKIMPKDELYIYVTSTNEEVSSMFNLQSSSNGTSNVSSSGNGGDSYYTYLVDNDGNINFPVIGKIHVQGLSRVACQEKIEKLIKPYFAEKENPIVIVRFTNYKVTIIGEVGGSRVLNVTNERLSIIDALAQAGDLSIYGKRTNILLIREDETGEKHYARLDIHDANIINSPYYYLQQNDIIYVEANKAKARNADFSTSTTFWITATSSVLSLASIIVNLVK